MKIGTDPEWAGYRGLQLPQFNESVLIPYGSYVVIDCAIPPLRFLQVEGILELDNGYNHTIEAEMIFINGGQIIVGWEVTGSEKEFQTFFSILIFTCSVFKLN